MNRRTSRRPGTVVWALLIVATVASWTLGTRHGVWGAGPQTATVGVLVIAFAKVRLIGAHFMELREAPRALVRTFDTWVVLVRASLVGLYLAGPAG